MKHLLRLSNVSCLSASLLAAACGGSADDPDDPDVAMGTCAGTSAETYSAGMTKTGSEGTEVTLVDATPKPPSQASNAWTLSVVDSDGAPVTGATLAVVPFMPEHGHGAPTAPDVADNGDGTYDVSNITFIMPGVWETTVTVTADGVQEDVMFAFCIE